MKDHIFHAALALGFMHIGAATVSVGATLPPGLRVDVIVTDTPGAFANGRQAKVVAVDLSWMSGKGVPDRRPLRLSRQRQRPLPHRIDIRLNWRSQGGRFHA